MVFIRDRRNQTPQKGKPTDVTVLAQLTLDYRIASAYFQHSTGTSDRVGGLFLSARKCHFPVSPPSGRRDIWFSIEYTMVHTKGSVLASDPQIPFPCVLVMHLKAHVSLLALLTSSSTPLKLPGCSRLQLTSHFSLFKTWGLPSTYTLSPLIFSVILLSQKALDMSSLFLLTDLESYRCPLDILSLIHNKNLSPDHGMAILVVSLLCPCLDS